MCVLLVPPFQKKKWPSHSCSTFSACNCRQQKVLQWINEWHKCVVFLCVMFLLDILFRIGLQWIADLFHNRETHGSLQCRHVQALQLIQYGGNHSSKLLSYSDNGGTPSCNFPRSPSLHKSESSFVLLRFYGRETLVRTFPVLGSPTPAAISALSLNNRMDLLCMGCKKWLKMLPELSLLW